ncbi:MAG: DNA polymerase III subunit alpha, partial [Oscillospiraceae bacterium]|nr:DNA polymerase III subunit alpha [Oscillospiraceae bacterium]
NVDGQMDLFGLSGENSSDDLSLISSNIEMPDLPEFTQSELNRMEREVTGLYLSGHPMDEYRDVAKSNNVTEIRDILTDFSRDDGISVFTDNQKITLAGVIENVKTRPTRNNSLMAYIALDDGSGSIELLAFQRVIDESGMYMHAGNVVLVSGKISARDDKEPQIVVDNLKLMTDDMRKKKLYVKLNSEDSPEYEHLKLVHKMFPGKAQMVIFFEDTKKKIGATCLIHDAFLQELTEKLGNENVVVR